jgi:hypothetical protein
MSLLLHECPTYSLSSKLMVCSVCLDDSKVGATERMIVAFFDEDLLCIPSVDVKLVGNEHQDGST